jgi:hypothetical protein
VRSRPKDQVPDARPKQPAVVKVLDLPDSETLRFNETTFVDLGWRQTARQRGEWVGHIGSDTEYLPLNAEQIAGILREAQLKTLPPPPVPRAVTPREKPAPASPAPKGIDLLGFIPILLGIVFMMYIRYRITQATWDAAQSATGMVQRALSDLLTPKKSKTKPQVGSTQVIAGRASGPVATTGTVKRPITRSSTVVRPSAGLFGMWSRAR